MTDDYMQRYTADLERQARERALKEAAESRHPNLFQFGWFSTHSNHQLPWKIDCDALTDDDIDGIARLIRWKFAFGTVHGVPRGGLRLQDALAPHVIDGYPPLIVDDVLTTGISLEEVRLAVEDLHKRPAIGVVIFARGRCPDWVFPIFTVNGFMQSRATGLK